MNTIQFTEQLRNNIDIPLSTILATIFGGMAYLSEYQLQGNVEKYKDIVETIYVVLDNHELSEKFTTFLTFHGGDIAMAPAFFFGMYSLTVIAASAIDIARRSDPWVTRDKRVELKKIVFDFSLFISLGLICLPLIIAELGSSIKLVNSSKRDGGDFDFFDITAFSVPLIATFIFYLRTVGVQGMRKDIAKVATSVKKRIRPL